MNKRIALSGKKADVATLAAQCVACQMPSTLYFSKLMASQYANMQMAPTLPDARSGILGRFGVKQSSNKNKNEIRERKKQELNVKLIRKKLMCKCCACKWNHLARFWTREKCLKVNRMQQILERIDRFDRWCCRAKQRRSSKRSQLNNLQFSRLGAASDKATLRRLDSIAAWVSLSLRSDLDPVCFSYSKLLLEKLLPIKDPAERKRENARNPWAISLG